MDIYIKWDDDKQSIQLPILPSSYEISGSQNNTSLYVHDFGEVELKGQRGLYSISIESFFPAQEYDFCACTPSDPSEYITSLKDLFENNDTIHLIITESEVNLFCTISQFSYGQSERNGDVQYKLELKEFREISSDRISKSSTSSTTTSTDFVYVDKTLYTWVKGDTWSKVVAARLGSSETWKTVRSANTDVITEAKKQYRKAHPNASSIKEETALIGYDVVIE